jgi:hypothetical protein
VAARFKQPLVCLNKKLHAGALKTLI